MPSFAGVSRRRPLPSLLLVCFLAAVPAPPAFAESGQIQNDAGLVLFYRGQYADAKSAFEQAIRAEPGLQDAHYNLGRAQRKLGDLKGAIRSFKRALEIKPGYSAAQTALKRAEADLKTGEERLVSDAESGRLKIRIPEELSYPWTEFTPGFEAYYAGDPAASKKEFERFEKENPGSARIDFEKGIIYYHLKLFEDSVYYFEKAVGKNRNDPFAHHNLGLAKEGANQPMDALAEYRAALALNGSFEKAKARLQALSESQYRVLRARGEEAYRAAQWIESVRLLGQARDLAAKNSPEAKELLPILTLAETRAKEIGERREAIKEPIFYGSYSYEDVWKNGAISFIGTTVEWSGMIVAIRKDRGETVLDVSYGWKPESTSSQYTNLCAIHAGRALPSDPRIAELALVTVVGRIVGGEDIPGGYRFGATTAVPRLQALKLTFENSTAAGPLVIETRE